jgi:hypothetical protein
MVEADGSYTIDLPGGGSYFVFARVAWGGAPMPGEWLGAYGEADAPKPVTAAPGQTVEGVDFVVRKP